MRVVIISICLLFTSIFGFGQEDSREGIKHQFGVKGGWNISTVQFTPPVSQIPGQGLILGGTYTFMAQKAAGILIEALLVPYGWEEQLTDPSLFYRRETTYIELPVLTNFVLGKRNTHFKIQLGPKVSYLLGDKESTNVPESSSSYYYRRPIESDIELGLALGAGLSRIFPIGEFELGLRYNFSFTQMWAPPQNFELQNSQNQSIAFGLTYWFDAK